MDNDFLKGYTSLGFETQVLFFILNKGFHGCYASPTLAAQRE